MPRLRGIGGGELRGGENEGALPGLVALGLRAGRAKAWWVSCGRFSGSTAPEDDSACHNAPQNRCSSCGLIAFFTLPNAQGAALPDRVPCRLSVAASSMMLMPANRPAIPSVLDRRVRVEAGHRCAIPICRTPVIEIAHIRPWAQVKRHEFENLIALCPTCHTFFDRGHIDRASMLQYKANLSPFSPYSLATHPDHIDFLAAYQKFHVFIEMFLAAASSFQAAKQRGLSAGELQARLESIDRLIKEAWYAEFCFCMMAPERVKNLAFKIWETTVERVYSALGRSMPFEFSEAGPADDLPTTWSDLHHEMHKVLNNPARETVKVLPTRPIFVDEVVEKNS